jgi:ferredoxin
MDNLFSFIFKAASVEPRYDEGLCLAAKRSVHCSTCRDVCPHEAITIKRKIEIDPVDCSGCGLCVQACPTQALEARVSIERGSSLKCSKVRGSATTVHCLGRLKPSDVLRLAGSRNRVALARAECASCPIGTAAVAKAIEKVREQALDLARLHGRDLSIELVETDRLDETERADTMSRRELLRGGWRSLQERTGDVLAPLDPGEDEPDLPTELQRRFRIIAASSPAPEALIPWSLPRVSDDCILCPACTRACPTDALERVFEEDGEGVLQLRPERCVGCQACLTACPVGAVTMEEPVTWGELAGGANEAYRRDPSLERGGSISR